MSRELLHRLIDEALDLRGRYVTRIPAEAKGHFHAARREVLLGLRSLVDHALEQSQEEACQTRLESRQIPIDP